MFGHFIGLCVCVCLCCVFAVGKLSAVVEEKAGGAANAGGGAVKLGEELPNCGVKEECGADGFPVHMYSGLENREGPKICVSGK